jgi:hypothetical protein
MKTFILIFIAIAAAATLVYGAEIREIELTDGSVIAGEIVSLSGDIYTVRSATLGTIQIEESKVRSIRKKSSTSNVGDLASPTKSLQDKTLNNPDTAGDPAGQIKSLQDKMSNDPEIMPMIQSLQDDPDFQAILQDPEIMKAVQNGDLMTLMGNPQFMKLLNKQTVQEIKNKTTK